MKTNLLLVFLFACMHASADLWTQKATFPGGGRELPFSFSIGNLGYAGGGSGFYDLWEYDPVSDTWTQKATMPIAGGRRASNGFSINSKGYVGFGHAGTYYADLWQYDPVTNAWLQMATLPAIGRAFASLFVIGSKAYVAGGTTPDQSDAWEWDEPTNVWTQKSSLPGTRRQGVGFSANGKGYVSTGWITGGPTNDLLEFDPALNTWTQKTSLPALARVDASAFTICDKGYVVTGGEAPYQIDLWQYDPVLDQWLQKTNFPGTPRDDATVFVIGNKAYLALGQNASTNLDDLWEYTPDSCNTTSVVAFSAPNPICPGTCTNFTNLSQNYISFQWSFPGASPSSSTDVNPQTICYNIPGSYDVTLIATNASGSDTLTQSNYINVYPWPPPQAISQSGDTLFANPGAPFYQWYFNGNIISGATDYFYIAPASGDYNVVATDANGCEVEAAIFNVVASGEQAAGASGSMQLEIYPNPVSDKVIIQSRWLSGLKVTRGTDVEISIYNMLGELAVQLPIAYCLLPTCSIDVSVLPKGIYFLEITSPEKTLRGKFIKE